MSSPKHVLVLGGNGFIGCEVVMGILAAHPDTQVTMVNRGQSWDWGRLALVGGQVRNIKHDRHRPLSECTELGRVLEEGGRLDGVVDLSGFSAFMVAQSVSLLAPRVGVYVYISSDSVYEVCDEKAHTGPTRETDAVRPRNAETRRQAALNDDYGDEKLQCEEVICDHMSKSGDEGIGSRCRFVMLRLADVVGARDSTDRWWQYQVWVKLAASTNTKVILPRVYAHRPLSFVYVKDVANLIVRILFDMSATDLTLKAIDDKAFNLACRETPMLDELIGDMRRAIMAGGVGIGEKDVDLLVEFSDTGDVPQIYPSVERGSIDITKAVSLLGWNPTPWVEVVRETVRFYEDVLAAYAHSAATFRAERKNLYRTLQKDLTVFYTKDQLRTLKEILFLN